jgi:hypothetical protein
MVRVATTIINAILMLVLVLLIAVCEDSLGDLGMVKARLSMQDPEQGTYLHNDEVHDL